ncbi:MAG: hypothetical protein LAP39_28865 [Acidobacteriia bacterium]|nr:hypothetical protein [Terriglobia bacterium]
MGDVLPKGSQPQPASSQELAQLPGSGYTVPTSTVANPFGQVAGEEKTADAPNAGANRPVDSAAPDAPQQAQDTRDARSEISKAAGGSDGAIEAERNAGEPNELAFAAQISARTPDPKWITPNEGQAAIAASRFAGLDGDSAKTQSHAGPAGDPSASAARTAQRVAEPQPPQASEVEAVAVAASGFEGQASDGSSGDAPSDREPNASAGAGETQAQPTTGALQKTQATLTLSPASQPATAPNPDAQMTAQPQASAPVTPQPTAGRASNTQATSGTIAARIAATGREGSNPGAGTQNPSSGVAVAGPPSGNVAGGRSTTNTKSARDDRAPQFLEAQNEPAERAGEIVRDISLNLSSKDQSVQVRLSERAGELHVTVRTPDAGLTHGLREGLSDLVGRLEHGGYRAEAWQPGGNDAGDRSQDSPSRRGSSQQQNNGGKGSGQQENSQDPESESQRPKWMGELESSLQRSNSVWPPSAIR